MHEFHIFHQRVYTQHTDAWGLVYHANYFAFAEYARAELFRSLGMPLSQFTQTHKGFFAVVNTCANFVAPAFLDDLLSVQTRPVCIRKLSLTLTQNVTNPEKHKKVAKMTISLAWLNRSNRLAPLPKILVNTLQERYGSIP